MNKRKIEFYVGIFVIIGLSCVAYIITQLGEVRLSKNYYPVYAYFTSISGLSNGATVEMAGVQIGEVVDIDLDKEKLLAKVKLSIYNSIELSEDVIASVKTSGIIGDKYIDISPGGSELMIEAEGVIYNTESAVDLESLVRKYIFNKKEE